MKENNPFTRLINKQIEKYYESISKEETKYRNSTNEKLDSICKKLEELKQANFDRISEITRLSQRLDELDKLKQANFDRISEITRLSQRLDELDKLKQANFDRISEITRLSLRLDENDNAHNRIQNVYSRIAHTIQQIEAIDDIGTPLKTSYAQSGEDMIIEYIFNTLKKPISSLTYLDLGANHAKLLSNTYDLYTKGARGVLVEANPNLINELKMFRSDDVILNRCISEKDDDSIKFYIMSGDGLSTSDEDAAAQVCKMNSQISIKEEVEVLTITVKSILDKYFNIAPDIISIDLEGLEMSVIKQFDFRVKRPSIFIIEMIDYDPELTCEKKNKEIFDYMIQNNYLEYAFTGINSIFISKDILLKS